MIFYFLTQQNISFCLYHRTAFPYTGAYIMVCGMFYMITRIAKSRSPKLGNTKTRFFCPNLNKPCCTYTFCCNLSEALSEALHLPRCAEEMLRRQRAEIQQPHSALAVQYVALCLIYYNYFNICSEDRNLFISSEVFLWHSLLWCLNAL